MDDSGVIYHGTHTNTAGAGLVTLETPDGTVLGMLTHVVAASPTGLSWGYEGSGPADLARSLLIDALGPSAVCGDCQGRRRVVFEGDGGQRPHDAALDADTDPELVARCWCGDGYAWLPYQRFKRDYVAGWTGEWRVSRTEVLRWLRENT